MFLKMSKIITVPVIILFYRRITGTVIILLIFKNMKLHVFKLTVFHPIFLVKNSLEREKNVDM